MDGAGGIIFPELDPHHEIFLQGVWQEDKLSYVLFNERDEDVEVVVRENYGYGCGDEDCPVRERWAVPANSVRRFDTTWLTLNKQGGWVEYGDGVSLGHLPPQEAPPVAGTLPLVTNSTGLSGWSTRSVQIETSSIGITRAPSTLSLVISHPGQLRIRAHQEPSFVPWLDVTDVRGEAGTVQHVGDEFIVDIPEGTSVTAPALIEADVSVPAAIEGRLVVGFAAGFCWDAASCAYRARADEECSAGYGRVRCAYWPGVTRLFQLEP
jgi:hypothetical protein